MFFTRNYFQPERCDRRRDMKEIKAEREGERETDRQTDRQSDRQADRETDRERDFAMTIKERKIWNKRWRSLSLNVSKGF